MARRPQSQLPLSAAPTALSQPAKARPAVRSQRTAHPLGVRPKAALQAAPAGPETEPRSSLAFDVGNIAIAGGPPFAPPAAMPAAGAPHLEADKPRSIETLPSAAAPAAVAAPAVAPDVASSAAAAAELAPAGLFSGLRSVARAVASRAAAIRARKDPPNPPSRVAAAHWLLRVEAVLGAANEAERASARADAAASSASRRPDVIARLPLATEAARIALLVRATQAFLATIIAGRAAENLPLFVTPARRFAERLINPASFFEDILSRGGDARALPAAALDSATNAASTEGTRFYDTIPNGAVRLRALGFTALFDSALMVERALSSKDASVKAQLNNAASKVGEADADSMTLAATTTDVSSAATVTPSTSSAAAARSASARSTHRATPQREADSPRAQLAEARAERTRWEYTAGDAATPVDVSDIALSLELQNPQRLRDALLDALRTKRQFVLWCRANTRLSADVQRLVSDGLIETRTLR